MKNRIDHLPQVFSLTSMAHAIVSQSELTSQFVIDATCGNGHDTAFLAQEVGNNGHVFAFDIQHDACVSTNAYMQKLGLQNIVTVIHDSHSNMTHSIPSEYHKNIAVIMFNLGYLPASEKIIKTQPLVTQSAIHQSLELLKVGGIITIAIYTDHPGGEEELFIIQSLLSELSPKHFRIAHLSYPYRKKKAPQLYIIYKER